MAKKDWYLFKEGVTFGPLPTEVVQIMLEQKRVKQTEYIWTRKMDRWERIRDIPEFSDEWKLPPYPSEPIPSLQEVQTTTGGNEEEVEEASVIALNTKKRKKKTVAKKGKVAASVAPEPVSEPVQIPKISEAAKEEDPEWNIRRSPRVPVSGEVVIPGKGTFVLVDISETGMLIRTDEVFSPGTNLDFSVTAEGLNSEALQMTGVVARKIMIGSEQHVGIEFTRVNPAYKRILSEFVNVRAEAA